MSSTHALRRLIAEAIAIHELVAASLGINATDLRCLQLLEREPEMTPSRLAELAGITTGAVTGVLDRLEAAGYVRRETDRSDRRRFILRPVPERLADVAAAYVPILERANLEAAGRRGLDALADVLGREAERLRVTQHGGILDNAYATPLRDIERARLVLATGAPRLNVSRSALGQQVRVVAETAATRLRVRADATGGQLIRAEFVGPPPDVRTSNGAVTMRYRRRMLDTRAREIDVRLHPGATWGIEIDGGITDLEGDLGQVPLSGIDLRGGANHVRLVLPRPSGTVRLVIAGGASDVQLRRPTDIPVSLIVRGGAAHLRFDGRGTNASATDLRMSSDDWGTKPDRYVVEIGGGVARLAVEGS
jgi:DNA-binding MarR family transcriptional regulator